MKDPKWLELARKELGTIELPGPRSNPTVGGYYRDAVGQVRTDDVPWCAAFVGSMLRRAGVQPSGSLMARSYLQWGQKLAGPIPGAIAVFGRGGSPTAGHVAFVEKILGGDKMIVLGGNQSDAVTRASRRISSALGYRWPSGVPMAKAITRAAEEKSMSGMTPKEIMDAASKIYSRVDRWGMGDATEIRQAIKKSIECLFYLAKMQLPPEEQKSMKKGMVRKPVKKVRKK